MDRAARAAFNSGYYLESAEIALKLHKLRPETNIFIGIKAIAREDNAP